MITVDKSTYNELLPELLESFKQVHPGDHTYHVLDLKDTHLKLVELVNPETNKAYFRVLLKATYEIVRNLKEYPLRYEEVNWLSLTPTDNNLLHNWGTARQICIIQLDNSNKPVDELLFTYSSENKFVRIEKRYPNKE